MTVSEFRAWLDGYSAVIGDAPTADQWATIKAKLADVHEPFSIAPADRINPSIAPVVYPRTIRSGDVPWPGYWPGTCRAGSYADTDLMT